MAAVSVQLVYPLCAMFFLSVVVLGVMFLKRVNAAREGKVKLSYYKTFSGNEPPEDVVKAARHFSNLFEAPILFYVACILGMILPVEGILFLILSWLYVAARVVHAYIHIGPNKIYPRATSYGLGWLVLLGMWILILLKAFSISAIS